MKDFDPQAYEPELASLKPARMPEGLSADLRRALTRAQSRRERNAERSERFGWLRWALPVGAVTGLMIFFLLGWRSTPSAKPGKSGPESSPAAVLKPDAVVLSQELVANFETVTRLPDGSPVRFRCEEWVDEIQLRDPVKGVWIEHRKPRLEVYPVGYEIY